ncbi:MAG: uncharacterized membrane protein YkvA (DUF1232 family) [Gammaproteobacteria bacterium]|jgi:uncharacterized membrane protein YkvA (DUF1232 family)
MKDEQLANALEPTPGQETYVRDHFWPKVRAVLGRVPLIDRALAAYFAAVDPATPARVKGVLFAALAYFVLPIDVIPDFIFGIGFTDDAAVLLAVMQIYSPHITETHVARAHEYLLGDGQVSLAATKPAVEDSSVE